MENNKDSNLELFFDVLSDSIDVLYNNTNENYLQMIDTTCKNILAGEVLNDFDSEEVLKLQKIYDRIEDVDFNVEDVRRAMQAIILRGFKETNISNGSTTPDSLGIFLTYLITRLTKGKKNELSILDPLVGTGNLIFTIANHLEDVPLKLYGIDREEMILNLARATADLLQLPIELKLQDTLNSNISNMDFVVMDMPYTLYDKEKNHYALYDIVKHHTNSLKENGYMLAIIPNDFFDYDKKMVFKKELVETMAILGIIELPDNLFASQTQGKSILLLKKGKIEDAKCLVVKLPSFSDVKEFNNSLMQIETWFENNIK